MPQCWTANLQWAWLPSFACHIGGLILRAAAAPLMQGTAGTPFHTEPGGIISPFISRDTSPMVAPSPMQQPGSAQEPHPMVTPEPTTTSAQHNTPQD
jgi:hypothetical protein